MASAATVSRADIQRLLSSSSFQIPNKEHLWRDMQRLGRQLDKKLYPYSFIPRGGLSSPYVEYVSDIDLIFAHSDCNDKQKKGSGKGRNSSKGSKIHNPYATTHTFTKPEFQRLLDTAQGLFQGGHIMSMQITAEDDLTNSSSAGASESEPSELFDGELHSTTKESDGKIVTVKLDPVEIFENASYASARKSLGIDAVVVSGCYRWREYLIPMDISLKRGEKNMTHGERVTKYKKNLEDKNFAKAVQRCRGAMKNKDQKWDFACCWNYYGGKSRFLYKQLGMLGSLCESSSGPGMSESESSGDITDSALSTTKLVEYCKRTLGLPKSVERENLGSWLGVAEEEMQCNGAKVLWEFRGYLKTLMGVEVGKSVEQWSI